MLRWAYRWATLRRVMAACACTGLLLLAIVLGRGWHRRHLASIELEKLRSRGMPTNATELNAFVEMSPGERDATAAWMVPLGGWIGAIGTHPWGFELFDCDCVVPPAAPEEWNELDAASDYVAKHAPYYQAIDTAVATEGRCRFISDFGVASPIPLPHIGGSRAINRLLALRTFVESHQGDPGAAAADLQRMLVAGEILASEPLLISQLVRAKTHLQTSLCVERLLSSIAAHEAELGQLQRTLEAIDLLAGLRTGLIGYRAECVGALRHSVNGRLRGAWHGDDPLEVLKQLQIVEQKLATDWPGPLVLVTEFDQDLHFGRIGARSPWGQRDIAPSFGAAMIASRVEWIAEVTARLRATAAAIATVRYRQANNAWPNSLEALVPKFADDLPVDPFTGDPLKLVRADGKLHIYSIGPNRKDDGGVETPVEDADGNLDYKGEPDVVFRVPMR